MITFVKLYTRQFHVTSRIFLRKIAPKTSSNDHKYEFNENNSAPSSSCQSLYPDYLGVESEENVINVNPQSHRFLQSQKDDNREKFYRASFGIVRFDAENKPRHHGQYKRKVDFTFPHSSSEVVKVCPISETYSNKNQIHQKLPFKDYQKNSSADPLNNKTDESITLEKNTLDSSYIDEFYFGTSITQNNLQQKSSEELNYLEKDYFETIVDSSNLEHNTSNNLGNKGGNDYISGNKNQVEEINYLEKDYFATLVDSNNQSVEHNTSNNVGTEGKKDFISCNKNQVEEINYLEKDYFGTLVSSENQHLEVNFSDFNSKTADTVLSAKDQLEEKYFGAFNSETHFENQNISNYFNEKEKSISICNRNNQNIPPEKNDVTSTVCELNFLDKTIYKNNLSSDVQNSSPNDDILISSSNFVEKNVIDETKYNKYIERKQNSKVERQKEVALTDNNINHLTENKAYEKNKKLSSSKIHKIDMISHKHTEPLLKNSSTSNEIHEYVKPFSVENSFQFSKHVSKESDPPSNEMSTAHDFVKKLRDEQKIQSQILFSKEKRINEEKFDSKGFRILKNQVPNLTYFTRDEILNILKQNVVYSDDNLLILNKPYSLVIHESKMTKEPCLSTFLDDLAKEMDKQSRNPKLLTVHRLDKETTGCLLLARNETMAMHLKALFAQRKIVKKYWIITAGVPDPPEGVIDIPISEGSINNKMRMVLSPKLERDIPYKNHSKKGKPAVTTYKVMSESGNAALVEVFPKTGVKHQIRVHFGFGLGCPVLGDHKYSHLDKLAPQKLPSDLLQRLNVRQSKVRHIPMHIHAKSVGIPEYFDKRDLFVNIPIPEHFKINLHRLKFRKRDMIH